MALSQVKCPHCLESPPSFVFMPALTGNSDSNGQEVLGTLDLGVDPNHGKIENETGRIPRPV